MADVQRLEALIAPQVEAEGLLLVRVAMTGGTDDPTLQVMAERRETRQLTLEDCTRLSRRLSERLDEADPIDGAYRLEVSSPGIDRPLTRLTDFADWCGHEARLTVEDKEGDRRVLKGALGGTEGGDVLLAVPGRGETRIRFADISAAKLLLTDRLIAATAPLSSEGADEIQTPDIEPGQD